jgi:DNA-binding NarL/FixJ family response regulator
MKILLADDHALIRSGLRNELGELDAAVQFVEAWDAESLRHALEESAAQLDLALIDLTMPGMNGAATIADLRRRYPTVPLVVISGADPAVDAQAVLRAGAVGFIPKSAMAGVMLQAIRLVLAGGHYLPPQLMRLFENEGRNVDVGAKSSPAKVPTETARLHMLSQRQREVFALLAKGLSNKMIARELNITEGTVKTHVATIFDVFHVHNRVSAVVEARRLFGEDGSD